MERKEFQAESRRLLEMMINSIYTNKEIFLRELISNASDALDKRHYLSLTNADQFAEELCIHIERHPESSQLVIEDNGVGMTAQELEENLGTIAKSGSAEFMKQLEKNTDTLDIIGQFGVGFYSAFMVAKKITVESKPADGSQAHIWESTGQDGYTIDTCDKETVGTRITLELKEDTEDEKYSEYLDEYTIRDLVHKYSNYVKYPIRMMVTHHVPDPADENKTIDTLEEETLNSMIPLWKKNKNDITEEEYNDFYKQTFSDWNDPLKTVHYNVEGNISYTALLYIPSKAPYNFYYSDYEPGLKLYSKGVFILDKAKDLIPDEFRFVQGLIDSDDLNLNISREILQQDRQVRALSRSIDKKIRNTLEDMLKEEREKYETFFDNFGLNLKYGIYKDYGTNKEKLQDLILFKSSREGKYVTLREYRDRMPEDQKAIYYACGSSVEEIEKLPVLDKIRDKGYEVLYFLDQRDEFVSGILREYDGKNFQSVSQADLDLDTEEEKEQKQNTAEANKDMLAVMGKALSGKVKEVRISSRLKDDPVCVVAEEGGVSLEMEKYMANDPMNKNGMIKATKILEINPDHPVFGKLQEIYQTNPDELNEYADVLLNQALLIQGLQIDDPIEYARKITKLILNTK